MACLQDLSEDIHLLILLQLSLRCVLRARQTCLLVYRASQAKILWLNLLWTIESENNIMISPRKDMCTFLNSSQVEALVHRGFSMIHDSKTASFKAKTVHRLDLPQSVTWTHLVNGCWLFVASSDTFTSKLTCWDISLVLKGSTVPIAECFLPGRVRTGQMEIQDEVIVLAVGVVGPGVDATHILSLQRSQGQHVFCEICRLEGSTHVEALSGDFIVCALHDDVSIPRVINWKTFDIYPLGNVPSVEPRPLSYYINAKFLVLVYHRTTRTYRIPTGPGSLQLSSVHDYRNHGLLGLNITSVVPLPALHDKSGVKTSYNFLLLSDEGIHISLLEKLDQHENCFRLHIRQLLKTMSAHTWYDLCAGKTGQFFMWLRNGTDNRTSIACARLDRTLDLPALNPSSPEQLNPPDDIAPGVSIAIIKPPIAFTCDMSTLPALWAFPKVDFDDASGLAVVGNVFGELALIDLVGHGISANPRAIDGTTNQLNHPLASQNHILLNLPPLIPDPLVYEERSLPHVPSLTEGWGRELLSIELPSGWSIDWPEACDWNAWQGFESDSAWIIGHYFRMLGKVQPVAFRIHGRATSRIVRAGGLILNLCDGHLLWVYPGDASVVDIMAASDYTDVPSGAWHPQDAQLCTFTHIGAFSYNSVYEHNAKRRNRWIEQKSRGGRPSENLLSMHKLPQDFPSPWNP